MTFFIKAFKKHLVFSLIILGLFFGFLDASEAAFGIDPSIKQVKTADNPTVYYLDHQRGFKKAYTSEKAFLSYGNKWSDIKVISQEALDAFKTAYVVKTFNNPTVYYITENKKIAITSEQEFNNNGYKWEDIIILSEEDIKTYNNSEFVYYGGPDMETAYISIGDNEPLSYYAPLNTDDNLIASYKIGSPDKTLKITEINVKVNGVYVSNEIIKKAKLKIIGNNSVLAESDYPGREIKFNLTRNPLTITAGNEKEIGVYLDLGFNDSISNQSFYATIESVDSIKGDYPVSGNYPLNGKTLSLIDGSGFFSNVLVEQISLNKTPEVIIGSSEELVAKYKIKEESDEKDLSIKEVTFKNYGDADSEDFNNFKLKDQHNKTVSIVANIIDDLIVFQLNDYRVTRGNFSEFKVYADIVDGENKKIQLELESMKVINVDYNYYLPISTSHLDEEIIIKRESLAVLSHELEINNKVFNQESGNIIGVFEIRSDNAGVILKEAEFMLEKGLSSPDLVDTVFMVNYDTGDVIDSIEAGVFSNSASTLEFKDYVLDSRDKLKIALIAKISDKAQSGDDYRVVFDEITYENQNKITMIDNPEVYGSLLNVSRSNLYIYPNHEEGMLMSTKGAEKAKIASFFLESSSDDDLVINSLTLSRSEGPGSVSYDNGFSNLKLYIGNRSVGNIIERPYSGELEFNGFSYTLKNGKRAEAELYADLEKNLKVDNVKLGINYISAVSKESNILSNVNNLNTNSYEAVFNSASARIINNGGGTVNPGEEENLVASFIVENTGDEELKLKNITIETNGDGFSYSKGYSYLQIKEKTSGKRVGRVSKPVAGSNEVSMGYYKIAPGAQVEFQVFVDASLNVGDENHQVFFRDLEAYGSSSKVDAVISGDSNGAEATVNSGAGIGGISLIMPINGSINYGFHDPYYPFKDITEHNGIDIFAFQGTFVKAAADGTVSQVVDGGLTGYSYVTIEHSNGFKTVYGHLSEINVSVGDSVSVNDVIGRSGGTPGTPGAGSTTTGPHLHFEVWYNGVTVDPENYL
jgi:murein DD-endopeptidase MepM/ murein hydrolase activator NlpD